MEEILCPECQKKVSRVIGQRGGKNQKQTAYKLASDFRRKLAELMTSLEADMF